MTVHRTDCFFSPRNAAFLAEIINQASECFFLLYNYFIENGFQRIGSDLKQ